MNHKEFAKILEAKGCRYVRSGKGSHRIYYSPITKLEMPIPWHGEIGKGLESRILKAFGIK